MSDIRFATEEDYKELEQAIKRGEVTHCNFDVQYYERTGSPLKNFYEVICGKFAQDSVGRILLERGDKK